eukprot:499084-Amphidinium_carterae.1
MELPDSDDSLHCHSVTWAHTLCHGSGSQWGAVVCWVAQHSAGKRLSCSPQSLPCAGRAHATAWSGTLTLQARPNGTVAIDSNVGARTGRS